MGRGAARKDERRGWAVLQAALRGQLGSTPQCRLELTGWSCTAKKGDLARREFTPAGQRTDLDNLFFLLQMIEHYQWARKLVQSGCRGATTPAMRAIGCGSSHFASPVLPRTRLLHSGAKRCALCEFRRYCLDYDTCSRTSSERLPLCNVTRTSTALMKRLPPLLHHASASR